jgi:hypothetical protein
MKEALIVIIFIICFLGCSEDIKKNENPHLNKDSSLVVCFSYTEVKINLKLIIDNIVYEKIDSLSNHVRKQIFLLPGRHSLKVLDSLYNIQKDTIVVVKKNESYMLFITYKYTPEFEINNYVKNGKNTKDSSFKTRLSIPRSIDLLFDEKSNFKIE